MRIRKHLLVMWLALGLLGCSQGIPEDRKALSHSGVPDDHLSEFQKRLFDDLEIATISFEKAMCEQKSYKALAEFMHKYPKRYALLMKSFEDKRIKRITGDNSKIKDRWSNPYGGYTLYVHKMAETSRQFAVKSANSWRKGWSLTAKEVVPKLRMKSFPSTRRQAIEFLKHDNEGDDFGYAWRESPDSQRNRIAIQKWEHWLQQRISEQAHPTDGYPINPSPPGLRRAVTRNQISYQLH
jgi:hypothetical protein